VRWYLDNEPCGGRQSGEYQSFYDRWYVRKDRLIRNPVMVDRNSRRFFSCRRGTHLRVVADEVPGEEMSASESRTSPTRPVRRSAYALPQR